MRAHSGTIHPQYIRYKQNSCKYVHVRLSLKTTAACFVMSPAYSRSPVLYGLCLSAWELVTASRQKIGILISMVTLTLSAGTVIGMAFDRDLNPLQRYDKQCR